MYIKIINGMIHETDNVEYTTNYLVKYIIKGEVNCRVMPARYIMEISNEPIILKFSTT